MQLNERFEEPEPLCRQRRSLNVVRQRSKCNVGRQGNACCVLTMLSERSAGGS